MQPETTELTGVERGEFLRLVKKVGWRQTGVEVFESFFPVLPMTSSEQAVVRVIDGVQSILLWYRSDEHYSGWHIPGGYILLGETDWQWCSRVLKKETNLNLTRVQFIRRFNTRPEMGCVPNHQMAHFFLCEAEGEPTRGKFFPLTAVPEDTLGHHKYYIDCLRAHFMRMETMRFEGIRYDHPFVPAEKWPVEGKWALVNRWRAEGKEHFSRWGIFDTLDEALKKFRLRGSHPLFLIDDQGLQVI